MPDKHGPRRCTILPTGSNSPQRTQETRTPSVVVTDDGETRRTPGTTSLPNPSRPPGCKSQASFGGASFPGIAPGMQASERKGLAARDSKKPRSPRCVSYGGLRPNHKKPVSGEGGVALFTSPQTKSQEAGSGSEWCRSGRPHKNIYNHRPKPDTGARALRRGQPPEHRKTESTAEYPQQQMPDTKVRSATRCRGFHAGSMSILVSTAIYILLDEAASPRDGESDGARSASSKRLFSSASR